MSEDVFGGFSDDELGGEYLKFADKSEIVMQIVRCIEDKERGRATFECRVLTDEHKNKLNILSFNRYITDSNGGRKINSSYVSFLRTFYNNEELRAGPDPAKLLGRVFKCVSHLTPSKNGGDPFQNYRHFKDESAAYDKAFE